MEGLIMYKLNKLNDLMQEVSIVKDTPKKSRIVDQYGGTLSTVSNRYELVKHKDILKPFIDKFGINSFSNIKSYDNRRSFVLSIDTGREFNLGNTGSNLDVLKERLYIRNSYDRTKTLRISLGAYRLICSNGLMSLTTGFDYRKKHIGNIDTQSIIKEALNGYKDNDFSQWRKWRNTAVNKELQLKIVDCFDAFEVKKQYSDNEYLNKYIRNIAKRMIDKPRFNDYSNSLWNTYNQINYAISYAVRNPDKVLSANNRLEKFINLN